MLTDLLTTALDHSGHRRNEKSDTLVTDPKTRQLGLAGLGDRWQPVGALQDRGLCSVHVHGELEPPRGGHSQFAVFSGRSCWMRMVMDPSGSVWRPSVVLPME